MTQTFRVGSLPLLQPLFITSAVTLVILFFVMEADSRWIILIIGGVLLLSSEERQR